MPKPPSTDAPIGPLELERKQGFRDTAVEGGLGPLLARWASSQTSQPHAPDLLNRLVELAALAEQYGALDVAGRTQVVESALALAREVKQPRKPAPTSPLLWATPVGFLKGVGPKRAEKLAELGLRTVGDLLSHYPLRHEDRRSPAAVRDLQHRERAT